MASTTSPRPQIVNVPNVLTTSRLGLALVLFVLISYQQWLGCLAIFLLAALTDWLDGFVARRHNLVSALGRNLDPVVDKVLVCGTFIFLLPFAQAGLAPWIVAIVVSRELIITSLRGYMESLGVNFGADALGKIKMVLQSVALVAIFVALWAEDRPDWPLGFLRTIQMALVYAMTVATILSGAQYLWKAALQLRRE